MHRLRREPGCFEENPLFSFLSSFETTLGLSHLGTYKECLFSTSGQFCFCEVFPPFSLSTRPSPFSVNGEAHLPFSPSFFQRGLVPFVPPSIEDSHVGLFSPIAFFWPPWRVLKLLLPPFPQCRFRCPQTTCVPAFLPRVSQRWEYLFFKEVPSLSLAGMLAELSCALRICRPMLFSPRLSPLNVTWAAYSMFSFCPLKSSTWLLSSFSVFPHHFVFSRCVLQSLFVPIPPTIRLFLFLES